MKKESKILLVYPYTQYAINTTESVIQKCLEDQKKHFNDMQLSFLPPFYHRKDYIEFLSKHIRVELPAYSEHLLFSYRGMRECHMRKIDPSGHCKIDYQCCSSTHVKAHDICYRHKCYETTRLADIAKSIINAVVPHM